VSDSSTTIPTINLDDEDEPMEVNKSPLPTTIQEEEKKPDDSIVEDDDEVEFLRVAQRPTVSRMTRYLPTNAVIPNRGAAAHYLKEVSGVPPNLELLMFYYIRYCKIVIFSH
jgi:hypothetical protein